MMLRWRSRALAVTLIAFIVLGTTGSGHAPDYRLPPLGYTHDGTHTQVCPPTDRASSEHCAICHWLQTFRFDPGAMVLVSFGDVATSHVRVGASEPHPATVANSIPARAPPA
jgi:hypothetical protein